MIGTYTLEGKSASIFHVFFWGGGRGEGGRRKNEKNNFCSIKIYELQKITSREKSSIWHSTVPMSVWQYVHCTPWLADLCNLAGLKTAKNCRLDIGWYLASSLQGRPPHARPWTGRLAPGAVSRPHPWFKSELYLNFLMLRNRDGYPRFRILIFSIPDPGSRIQQPKRGREKKLTEWPFCSNKCHKIINFLFFTFLLKKVHKIFFSLPSKVYWNKRGWRFIFITCRIIFPDQSNVFLFWIALDWIFFSRKFQYNDQNNNKKYTTLTIYTGNRCVNGTAVNVLKVIYILTNQFCNTYPYRHKKIVSWIRIRKKQNVTNPQPQLIRNPTQNLQL